MKGNKAGLRTIDEYIATFPEEMQELLERVRSAIHTTAPEAREKISYKIPAFELDGKNLVYFAGWNKHISIYPIPTGDDAFHAAISPYVSGKGTLKFPVNKPLPLDLIRKVVQHRVAETIKNTGMKSSLQNKRKKK